MGVSRDTFYRYQSARYKGGIDAFFEKSKHQPNPKNKVEPQIEEAVLAFAHVFPAHGQVRASNDLRKQGIFGFCQWRPAHLVASIAPEQNNTWRRLRCG